MLKITLIGLIAGITGTGLGSLISVIFISPTSSIVGSVLGFAGGIMVSVVCFDLIPEALKIGGLFKGMIGILAGITITTFLDQLLPYTYSLENNGDKYIRTGILLGISVAMHNLPEGLAIGAGYVHSPNFGLALALLISLHNLPEGVAMAVPMRIGGVSPIKIILISLATGAPMGLGAYIGVKLGAVSQSFLASALGFAGGAMLFISFNELIPESLKLSKKRNAVFSIAIGIIIGILISLIT